MRKKQTEYTRGYLMLMLLKWSTIGTQDLEDLSLSSFDGTLDPSPLPGVASTETDGLCRRLAEEGRSFHTTSTSSKPVCLLKFSPVIHNNFLRKLLLSISDL